MNENEAQLLHTLETATKHIAAAVTRCSRELRFLWTNQAYVDWIQQPLNEIADRPILEVLGKEAFEALLPHFNRVLTGETVRYEQEADFRGIGARWIWAVYTPTFDADGTTNGWMAVVVDITERKWAELRQSEEWLRLAIQAGKMYAYEWDVTIVLLGGSPVARKTPPITTVEGAASEVRTVQPFGN